MNPDQSAAPVAQTPRPHEHDSVAVTNIDTGCDETTQYTVERSIPVPSVPGENNPMNIPRHQSQTVEGEFKHDQYFEVRYNGQPFRIAPGETKIFPRYIAEHYAKHLADHILQKREKEEKRQGLVQSRIERPKTLGMILETKVWFLEGQTDPNAMLPQGNPNAPAHDLGNVPNYAVGNLRDEPKSADQILAETDSPPLVPPHPTPTPELMAPAGSPLPVAQQPAPQPPEVGDPFSQAPPLSVAQPQLPSPATLGQPLGPADDLQQGQTVPYQPPAGMPAGERSKPELIREAVMLGIEVNGRESVDDLKQKIAQF